MIRASSIRVLIVDDQTSIRTLIRHYLLQLGFADVSGVGDGREALAHLGQSRVHLVISDFNMPGMDGLALLRAVRADPALRSVAFIMLTGQTTMDLVQEAARAGANNFLAKPVTVGSLKARIEAVLKGIVFDQ
jgi:two-component system chemotaxis response regulator CheY